MTSKLNLADKVEITTILDNTVDVLLPSTDTVKRYVLQRDFFLSDTLVAEHGFSALVTVTAGERRESFLFDAGLSRDGLTHNMDVLDIKANELHAIVLSHGHADHSNGLMGLAKRLGGRRLPMLLHPDAGMQRKVCFPDGREIVLPPPDRQSLSQEGIDFVEDRKASYVLGGLAMVTGQIERTTTFEKGLPFHFAFDGGQWQADPSVHDDQAVIMNLKDKGLVILTGCGHAGVVNTIRHARKISGVDRVYAVIGGFHLSGPAFDPIIPETLNELKALKPVLIAPGHCTGWKAIHTIAREMPEAFVQNSVGTKFVL